MVKKITDKEILRKNPSITKEDIRESRVLVDEMQKEGIEPRGYQLLPPFERRRAKTCIEEDPRTIDLTSLRI